MKERHTIIIQIEGDKMVDFAQISYGEITKMPASLNHKTFPTDELFVYLYNSKLHLLLEPGGFKDEKLDPSNLLTNDVDEATKKLLNI